MKKSNILKTIIFIIIAIVILLIILNKTGKQEESNYTKAGNDINDFEVKERYECNEFQYVTVTVDDLVLMYFNKYKSTILSDLEKAYNLLNKEYREKKFVNFEGYKTYIINNINEIYNSTITSYKIEQDGESNRYICLDQNGNDYIFNENAVMDFDIILDTYTIDLPDFTEQYMAATEQGKVALNINKFIQAINDKDYRYAYNCLADSYKNNYFKTQEEFETYARENFYANSNIAYKRFDVQTDIYSYLVVLTNEETGEQMYKTFIMQLKEGTEFVLSFDK